VKRERFRRKKAMSFQELERSKIIFLSIAFLFLLTVCGGGAPPPSPPVKGKTPSAEKKKVEPPQIVEKVEQKEPEKKPEEFVYNPVGKPDPFKPFLQLTDKGTVRRAHLTPLQKYEISQLKLVAIIISPQGNVALVEDSQGKGYFLKKGTVIGSNDGKVKQILKDRVIIEEVYQDIFGQTKANEISFFLHPAEEGGES
jgi:type IV pilus assembly protein PilP